MSPQYIYQYRVEQKISTKPRRNYRLEIETRDYGVALEYIRKSKKRNPSLPIRLVMLTYATNPQLIKKEILV